MTAEPVAAVDRALAVALPKAEVHLHLEGCIPYGLVDEAARRLGAGPVPVPLDDDGRPVIADLAALLAYLDWSCALVRRPDELFALARGTAERAAAVGTGHVDVIVNPTHWPAWHGRLEALVDALDAGFSAAEQDGLATATLCVSLKRTQSRSEALEVVERLLDARHPRVSALSIDGDESRGSHNERFAEAFARAAAGGLRRCAHAGESSGPDGVREAVEVLGAERIDHGIRSLEDPALVAELATRGVPLDVCPSSNVILGVAADIATHPVERLRRAGVPVSLNTDDPLIYGIDLAGEYERCAAAFGWGRAEVVALARTSVESCFADDDRKRALWAALDRFGSAGPASAQETHTSHSSA